MKKIISMTILAFSLIKPVNAGIPVLSPTELVQAVIEYQQMLKDYEEQLTMVQQGYDQYKQLITDYQQTLKEWDHLLEQCQAYKDLWGSYKWDSFLNDMTEATLNGKSFSQNEIFALYDNEDYRTSRTLYVTKNGKVITYEDAIKLIDSLKLDKDNPLYDDMRVKENQVNSAVNRLNFASKQSNEIGTKIERIKDIQDDFEDLGDNSQLATMQYQARLQSESLNLQIQQMTITNEMLAQQNASYDMQSAKMHKAQTDSLTKAQKALNAKIEIDPNGSGKINF